MNYMIWNSCGIGARSFPALIHDLKDHYKLNFIAILETRCAQQMALIRAQRLGFADMEIVDCEGYSGGIWCLWDDSIGEISLVECNHQFIHFQIINSDGTIWHLTVVYASPNPLTWQNLWDNLHRL
ncbi:hypothetical protein QN277_011683 [Acacia crassicarpa]|uniref:Uncharacterized protein n=1 Tax=Acacia crassicarpa TaxID=499986 RepID=A0AAE1MZB6_9FABA|nr:hypothetical protein QN277_011683 [Acacia crassicarpa]